MKFERVPVQIARSGSGRFWCKYLGQVPEGSSAEVRSGSGRFWRRYPGQDLEGSGTEAVRFRKVRTNLCA